MEAGTSRATLAASAASRCRHARHVILLVRCSYVPHLLRIHRLIHHAVSICVLIMAIEVVLGLRNLHRAHRSVETHAVLVHGFVVVPATILFRLAVPAHFSVTGSLLRAAVKLSRRDRLLARLLLPSWRCHLIGPLRISRQLHLLLAISQPVLSRQLLLHLRRPPILLLIELLLLHATASHF